MYNVKASDIAKFLNADLIGEEMNVTSISSYSSPQKNSLIFAKAAFELLNDSKFLVLCQTETFEKMNENSLSSFIFCPNPRLAFAKAVQKFFVQDKPPYIHETAVISDNADIHPSVSIGAHCVIESGVFIGEGTVIKNNVIISENVQIGKFCYIKSGVIIGENGFGFDFEEDKTPIRLPHFGSVTIGDYVEFGSNSVVARGTIKNTIIEDHVKMDDQVFIAHNVVIKRGSLLAACSQISGSVEISENVWVGPNASIIQKKKIGNGATIGIGATVTSDVEPIQKIMGISAVPLRTLTKFMKILKK